MPVSAEEQIRQRILLLLYRHLPFGLVATVVNGVLIAILHDSLISFHIPFVWLGLLVLVSLIRLLSFLIYMNTIITPENIHYWENILVIGIVCSGIIWGSSAFFMLLHNNYAFYILIAFVLGGMAAGAAATFSAMRAAYYGFTIPALIPAIIIYITKASDPIFLIMAIMLGLFGILISVPAETNRKLIVSTFQLRFERENLIAFLSEERDRVQQRNEQLKEEITKREHLEKELRLAHSELEKKVAERTGELAFSNARLEEKNQELSMFNSAVSHDLRGPIQTIDGLLNVLELEYGKFLNVEGKQYLSAIRTSTSRMRDLITDLLTLSKINVPELQRTNINLSTIVEEIVQTLQLREPHRKINIHIQPDCIAECDTRLIRIALENLLDNAWKFTRKREVPQINFGMKEENGQTIYFIRDNGSGFDMKNAQRLFLPFQRFHRWSDFPGTGLGLSTVQRIIHRHEGRIWAESKTDEGTTFYFTIQR